MKLVDKARNAILVLVYSSQKNFTQNFTLSKNNLFFLYLKNGTPTRTLKHIYKRTIALIRLLRDLFSFIRTCAYFLILLFQIIINLHELRLLLAVYIKFVCITFRFHN